MSLLQWYRAHLQGEQYGFDAQSRQPEMTLGIIAHKWQKSIVDEWSTLTLKLMDRVIWNPKQKVPVALQKGPWPKQNFKKCLCIGLEITLGKTFIVPLFYGAQWEL